ncbi:FHA-domain containing protein [Thioalkalivibrio sulfidiphilus HL-EbGr7]|uniref:FHA-domain containing protein n=1 Tax=Thioalkalivibrio sulfidiphilus (strain HL-EbGR7) TaxID=396588 RepID=B8GNV0_THISH|nr:FHA domain-containing protein [Thioalkalivibrio sulfidiphilus]ACL72039.1 FHA-domain containing protein [Thioalkalivibrio sulfidiphilus HL-EbGr7]
MARLILTLNDQLLKDIPLSRETLTIGRKPDNDIHLDNHAVSGYHAQVITLLNDSFIEDLGSTNGTWVNGVRIRKRALQEGDEINIHHYRLRFTHQTGPVKTLTPDNLEKTMIVRMDALGLPQTQADAGMEKAVRKIETTPAPAGETRRTGTRPEPAGTPAPHHAPRSAAAATPAPQPATAGTGTLRILSGPNAGRSLELVKNLTTLGRPGVQVAAITKRAQGYVLVRVDAGASGESPKVNDQPIGNQARLLKHGDIIDIAGIRMEFVTK